jgi:Variant SH3 domain
MRARMVAKHEPELPATDYCKGDAVKLLRRGDEMPEWWYCRGRAGEGWIPIEFMDIDGESGRLLRDYTTRELAIEAGAVVTVMECVAGWCFVVDEQLRSGWVLEQAVQPLCKEP